jgi:hypothetical protein
MGFARRWQKAALMPSGGTSSISPISRRRSLQGRRALNIHTHFLAFPGNGADEEKLKAVGYIGVEFKDEEIQRAVPLFGEQFGNRGNISL